MQRKRYSAEFKREAVKLASQAGMVKRQVAEELRIHENLLRTWVRQLEARTQTGDDRARHSKKGGGLLREGTLVRYGFAARHRSIWPVRTMCRVLVVSRAGFYEWHSRSPSRRSLEDMRLMPLVRTSFFSTIKRERLDRKEYATRDGARADVFDYIERFYNLKKLNQA